MLLPTFIITFNSDTHISHVCVSFYMVYLSHSIDMHKNKKKQTAVFEIKRAWEGPWPAQVFEFPYNFSSNLAGVFFPPRWKGSAMATTSGNFLLGVGRIFSALSGISSTSVSFQTVNFLFEISCTYNYGCT